MSLDQYEQLLADMRKLSCDQNGQPFDLTCHCLDGFGYETARSPTRRVMQVRKWRPPTPAPPPFNLRQREVVGWIRLPLDISCTRFSLTECPISVPRTRTNRMLRERFREYCRRAAILLPFDIIVELKRFTGDSDASSLVKFAGHQPSDVWWYSLLIYRCGKSYDQLGPFNAPVTVVAAPIQESVYAVDEMRRLELTLVSAATNETYQRVILSKDELGPSKVQVAAELKVANDVHLVGADASQSVRAEEPIIVDQPDQVDDVPLSVTQQWILIAMLQLSAFDSDSRATAEKIANLAVNNGQNSVKHAMVALKDHELIKTKKYSRGGSWLTEAGRRRAEKLNIDMQQEKPPPSG